MRFGLRGWRLKPSPQSLHETTCHHDLFYSLCPGSLPFLSRTHTPRPMHTGSGFLFVLYPCVLWSGSLPASVLGDGGGVSVPVCVALRCHPGPATPTTPTSPRKILGMGNPKLILFGDRFLGIDIYIRVSGEAVVGETDKQQQQKGGQQTKERRRRERRRRVSLCLSISFFLLARGQAVGRAHSPALTIKLRPTSSMSSELQYDDRSRRAGFWPDYPHPRRRNEYPHNITPALHCPCTCTARPAPCDR